MQRLRIVRGEASSETKPAEAVELAVEAAPLSDTPTWHCARNGMGYCNKSIMLGRGPAPGVELRVAIQVVRRRLGDEFREPAESELSAGVTSPPVSGVRGLPLTPDDFLR